MKPWHIILLVLVLLIASISAGIYFSSYQKSQTTIQSLQTPAVFVGKNAGNVDLPDAAVPTTHFTGPTVRCAVINGMNITGFWQALADRFTADTGIHVETVAFGEKAAIDRTFRDGGVDLLTMHSCDKIMNVVADGLAVDPQPWARNDLILVGPASDPAHIKGTADAAIALHQISATHSNLIVHASLGAQEVLRGILDEAKIEFQADQLTIMFDDPSREVLKIAAEKNAYTLIGRIPFRLGRIPNSNLEVMVQGDPKLRRPYVVVTANPGKIKDARVDLAKKLSDYLRCEKTQEWIATWGRGKLDDQPIFYPMTSK